MNWEVETEVASDVVEKEGEFPFPQVKYCGGVEELWKVTIPLQGDPAATAQSMATPAGCEVSAEVEEEHPVIEVCPVMVKAAR